MECIDSIIESINKRKMVDLSKCKDDREGLKVGDSVAMLWFNDPNYYAGKLEYINGELGIHLENKMVGFVKDAHHVVKLEFHEKDKILNILNKDYENKRFLNKDYILNEFIQDLRNVVEVLEKSTKLDITIKVDLFRLFFEGWVLGQETILIFVGLKPGDFRNPFINYLSSTLNMVELGEYTPSEAWYHLTNAVHNGRVN